MARNGVQFNMWLSEEEKAKIQEKANKAGVSMSEYIMDFRMPVLRLRCNYRMRTKTEVMKEVFGFDKSERGLPYIMVQTSQISQLEVL